MATTLILIMQAFDASILQPIGPVYQGYEVSRLESSHKIKYGVVTQITPPHQTVEKLMIAEEINVVRPRRNWQFGQYELG